MVTLFVVWGAVILAVIGRFLVDLLLSRNMALTEGRADAEVRARWEAMMWMH
jgi:hypothetical protein